MNNNNNNNTTLLAAVLRFSNAQGLIDLVDLISDSKLNWLIRLILFDWLKPLGRNQPLAASPIT